MSRNCDVPSCTAEGRHEIDSEHVLCLKHAQAWDASEDSRIARMTQMHIKHPRAPEDEIWNEYVAEWLGAQS
jgi:hypothetical protein